MPQETLADALTALSTEAGTAGRTPSLETVTTTARRRRWMATGAVAAAGVAAAGVAVAWWPTTGGAPDPGPASEGPPAATGPLSLYPAGWDITMDALFYGTLQLTDGCLVVVGESGMSGRTVVPVFKAGVTTWDGAVLTRAGERYELGDEISMGGGTSSASDPELVVPESCPADAEVWLAAELSTG